MSKYTGLTVIRGTCKELKITYDQFAGEVREITKGSPLEGSPCAGYIALMVCGRKRPSPEMADAIAKAFPEKIRREDLIWPEDQEKACNG
jgi:hypothetical protein